MEFVSNVGISKQNQQQIIIHDEAGTKRWLSIQSILSTVWSNVMLQKWHCTHKTNYEQQKLRRKPQLLSQLHDRIWPKTTYPQDILVRNLLQRFEGKPDKSLKLNKNVHRQKREKTHNPKLRKAIMVSGRRGGNSTLSSPVLSSSYSTCHKSMSVISPDRTLFVNFVSRLPLSELVHPSEK